MTNTALASKQTEKVMRERDKMAADVELARIGHKDYEFTEIQSIKSSQIIF